MPNDPQYVMVGADRQFHPRPETFPSIRRSLAFYKIAAYTTGVLLLLLVVEMVFKYVYHVEFELGSPYGFIALTPEGQLTGLNLSLTILIVHGWFYVVYLVACYFVWIRMRWGLGHLLALALGGVVPFLSFFVEAYTHKRVVAYLADRERALAEGRDISQADELESLNDDDLRRFARLDEEIEEASPTLDPNEEKTARVVARRADDDSALA